MNKTTIKFSITSIILCLPLAYTLWGQTKEIDSIHSVLNGNLSTESRIDNLSSLAFHFKEQNSDSSLYFAQLAIDLATQAKLTNKLPKLYNVIGLAHYYQDDLLTAYTDFQLALNLAESLHDENQVGHSHNNLGRLLLKINDVEQSYDQFLFAKNSFEKINDFSGLAYFYRSLSEWYQHSKNYDSAIFYSKRAIKIRKQLNENSSLLSALLDVCRLYRLKKDYTNSLVYLNEFEQLSLANKGHLPIVDAKFERLELMLAKDSLANSGSILKEAFLLAAGNNVRLNKLQFIEAKIEKEKGNTFKAIQGLSQLVTDTINATIDLRREATSYLVEILYANKDFKQAEKYRSQLKYFETQEKKSKLLADIEKINFIYSNKRKEKLEREQELTDHKEKIIIAILISIIGSITSVLFIVFVYQKRRNKEKELHTLKEQALTRKFEDSEMINRKLVEESLLLICTHSLTGNLLTINSPGAKAIGFQPKELIGKNIKQLIGKSFTLKFEIYLREIISTGTSSGFLRILTEWKEGKIFLYRNILVSDGMGEPYIMCSAIDVTEWKNTEREQKRLRNKLAESERLYRLLSENSSDLVCLHAPDGTFLFISSSVNKILGYTTDSLIGTKLQTLVHKEDIGPFDPNIEKYDTLTFKENLTYRIRKQDNDYLWMETYIQPIFEKGKLTTFQTSSRDITIRKQYEEVLNQGKIKAEEANKYKSEFVSSMSHEIRTPLNAIVGLAGILLKRNPREDQIKIFQMLKSSSDSLLSIVNDILDFSKVEAGKMEVEKVNFNLRETLREIVDLFSSKAESKQISLVYEEDEKLPFMVNSDQLKIRQVLLNLISNAIKFTNAGQVTLSCTLLNHQNGIAEILFSVKDTGIGIETDKQRLIFQSFSQAGQDTSRVYGGTGLGLAIVRKFLNLMESEIAVESTKGEGSNFYFTLVVKEVEMPIYN